MPQLSPSEQEEFLGTPGVLMRIATVDAKGHPHEIGRASCRERV